MPASSRRPKFVCEPLDLFLGSKVFLDCKNYPPGQRGVLTTMTQSVSRPANLVRGNIAFDFFQRLVGASVKDHGFRFRCQKVNVSDFVKFAFHRTKISVIPSGVIPARDMGFAGDHILESFNGNCIRGARFSWSGDPLF